MSRAGSEARVGAQEHEPDAVARDVRAKLREKLALRVRTGLQVEQCAEADAARVLTRLGEDQSSCAESRGRSN